jgi:hypothetical protein
MAWMPALRARPKATSEISQRILSEFKGPSTPDANWFVKGSAAAYDTRLRELLFETRDARDIGRELKRTATFVHRFFPPGANHSFKPALKSNFLHGFGHRL